MHGLNVETLESFRPAPLTQMEHRHGNRCIHCRTTEDGENIATMRQGFLSFGDVFCPKALESVFC